MAFTREHYEAVARILQTRYVIQIETQEQFPELRNTCRNRRREIDCIREELARMFAADNPSFDAERFNKACEPQSGESSRKSSQVGSRT